MGKFFKKRNKSIVLSDIGIKKGDVLQFVPAAGVFTEIYVTVVDNHYIEYNGEIMTRAQFNKKFNTYQRQGTKTNEQQSTRYLFYKGNSLSEIWRHFCETKEILKPKENIKKDKKKKGGYVYILRNPSFKDNIFKCGNSIDYKKRMRQLDTSGIPTPFEAISVIWVPNCEDVEKFLHTWMSVDFKRIRKRKEFFEGDVDKVKQFLHIIVNTLFPNEGKIVI